MLHRTFAGTFDIIHLGTFLYEGWERDWSIAGKSDEENEEFTRKHGTLFEVKLYSPILGQFPDGTARWVCGHGKSLEEALDRARFQAIFEYTKQTLEAHGWKKQ